MPRIKYFESVPEIKGYRYWYGDIGYGSIIYLGTEDLAGFETELHLHFNNKLITTALLILGPAGLDNSNCILEYKKVVSILNSKYGHFKYQKTEKDPLMDDLIAMSACTPIQIGLYSIVTSWHLKNQKIEVVLTGDEDGFGIEIEYRFRPKVNRRIEKLKKAL